MHDATSCADAVPLSRPDLTDAEVRAVVEVIRSDHLSGGPRVPAFERTFADYVGADHAVAVSSGTAGLHLSLLAARIRSGDFVVTTPFSFVASANVILYEKAIPIFVDVQPDSLNLDPEKTGEAVAALTGGASAAWLPPRLSPEPGEVDHGTNRLKAILPADILGQACDLPALTRIASAAGLAIIEDACEALGTERADGRVGSPCAGPCVDHAAVFGFYPNKQITTAEGGMVVTSRDGWATVMRSLRNQGRGPDASWLDHVRLGFNYRLNEMSAAMGLAQMVRLNEFLERRSRVAGWYHERLRDIAGIGLPGPAGPTQRLGWFVYAVRLENDMLRDDVIARLASRRIPSRAYFPAIHLLPFYRARFGYEPGMFPIAETAAKQLIALPFSSVMTEQQVDLVCGVFRQVLAC